jgi:uncharacterized MnhB-related membrane protein
MDGRTAVALALCVVLLVAVIQLGIGGIIATLEGQPPIMGADAVTLGTALLGGAIVAIGNLAATRRRRKKTPPDDESEA